MFDRRVYWSLSASWILLVLLAFLSTNNAAFTGSVTLLVAVIVVLPLLLFALFTEGRQPRRPPRHSRTVFDVHTD